MRHASTLSRLNLLAAAAVACAALYSPGSHAMALGQVRVLSALGEPLLAEIDIPQITAQELAALNAGLGSPAQFEAAGMVYHPSLRETVLSVQRRPDGRPFLRIAGARPVSEPNMELLVLARGGAQPLLRDYTLQLQPRAPRDMPLAFGQARVLSARGEPLRAEIDVPQLPQGRNAGTRVAVAPAADFQAAGMAYSPGLADIRLSLRQRPDGRTFMSVTSDKPFNEASLDLLLEATSAAGRTVRDYSVPVAAAPVAPTRVSSGLVTGAEPPVALAPAASPATAPTPAVAAAPAPAPPAPAAAPSAASTAETAVPPVASAPAAAAAAQPNLPVIPPSATPRTAAAPAQAAVSAAATPPAPEIVAAAAPAPAPAATPAPAPAVAAEPVRPAAAMAPPAPPAPPAPIAAAPASPAATPAPPPPAAAVAAEPRHVKVRSGDTLSRIARDTKPAEVSLEQMLVALLRANPHAFIRGNANLLRAGADLTLPSPEDAGAIPEHEATSVLALQSRNFDEYRRRLAAAAPPMAASTRQASGRFQATLSEKKAAPPTRNRLSLSAGAVGRVSAEEKSIAARLARIAKERAERLASEAMALSRLQAPAQGPAASAAAPVVTGNAEPAAGAASGTVVTVPGR